MNDLKRKRRSDVGEYQTKRKKGGRYSSSAPSKTMNNSYYNDKQDGGKNLKIFYNLGFTICENDGLTNY